MQDIQQTWLNAFMQDWQQGTETTDLDSIAADPYTLNEQGESIPQRAQVNARYGRFLYYLVKKLQPQSILEIGMANGISSAYIAMAQASYAQSDTNPTHTIIDPFQTSDWQGAGRQTLKRLQLDAYIELIEDFSIHAVPSLEKANKRYDFCFIDGNHCLDYTLADVLMCDRVLNTGGILALDDSMAYGVNLAIPYLDQHRHNLRRLRFDNPVLHYIREHFFKRRRISLYQKIAEDTRGADTL